MAQPKLTERKSYYNITSQLGARYHCSLKSSSRRPNSASKSSGLASNSSSSSQLCSRTCHRSGVDNLGFRGEVFHIFIPKSSSQFSMCSTVMLVECWLVSGISGKSQSSIVLLTIENVRPLVVDDRQCWVSLEGHVRSWLAWLFLLLPVLGFLFPCPNSKSSSQFSEGSKCVLSQPKHAKQGKKTHASWRGLPATAMQFVVVVLVDWFAVIFTRENVGEFFEFGS